MHDTRRAAQEVYDSLLGTHFSQNIIIGLGYGKPLIGGMPDMVADKNKVRFNGQYVGPEELPMNAYRLLAIWFCDPEVFYR
jgi:hypothetical protein